MLFLTLALSSLLAVETLDVEMDASEKKKTGISKLSDKEKGELQAWIDNWYERRATPLLAKAKTADRKASLTENLQSGHYLRLSDNSIWNIRPSDTSISISWITPVDILITQSGDSTYPSKLTNSLTGSSVFARKVDRVPPASNPMQPQPPLPQQGEPDQSMHPGSPPPPPVMPEIITQ